MHSATRSTISRALVFSGSWAMAFCHSASQCLLARYSFESSAITRAPDDSAACIRSMKLRLAKSHCWRTTLCPASLDDAADLVRERRVGAGPADEEIRKRLLRKILHGRIWHVVRAVSPRRTPTKACTLTELCRQLKATRAAGVSNGSEAAP